LVPAGALIAAEDAPVIRQPHLQLDHALGRVVEFLRFKAGASTKEAAAGRGQSI
jgi:hypothetical protein